MDRIIIKGEHKMEEKTLIESKIVELKLIKKLSKIAIIIFAIHIIISGISCPIANHFYEESKTYEEGHYNLYGIYLPGHTKADRFSDEYDKYEVAQGFNTFGIIIAIAGSIVAIPDLICIAIHLIHSKTKLTVTDKRIYGIGKLGKKVDLPFDMVSAIGTKYKYTIAVSTSSGVIKFSMIENRDKMYEVIRKILLERQEKSANKKTVEPVVLSKTSNASELKEYKELLDMGAITQEEFDQKKKELLNK